MKKFYGALSALFLVCAPTLQAEIETTDASYSADSKVLGFLAKPAGEGPFPAVVVIHEWWGLNDQIKNLAKSLAQEGYVALAVDLYRGTVTQDSGEAHELMRGLPEDRAMSNLEAAFSYLQNMTSVKKEKIGAIGWCMGGGYSLKTATVEPTLAACVVYYGALVSDPAKLESIRAPVLGHFGAKDRGISLEDVETFKKSMDALGKPVQIRIYSKAGHAFANPGSANHRPQDAAEAWSRTLKFLAGRLKS